ncbi:MAG TPA: ATP-dependent DNA ligase [Gemmatimonadaceae bacterium]
MQLHAMAEVFEQLEATSARRTMEALVAGLLRSADEDELAPIVYLLQGQLRPPYEGVEIGVGEKLLVRVLADAYTTSDSAISRRLKQVGDLGLVAASLAPTSTRRRLTVHQAYEALLDVAQVSGVGSMERKRSLLAELLRRATAVEAKYLVRIAQGKLRLGVGDQTIVVAAALAALGDAHDKPVLEHAYNVRSDLGGVVRLAFTDGRKALDGIVPAIGTPVRPALAQRLPSADAIIERFGTVQAEPKYDGFRLQLHRNGDQVWAFSRRLENVTGMFPELTDGLRRQLGATRAIIEGEAVVYDPHTGRFLPFQVTMTRKRKTEIDERAKRYPLRLFAFDLLYAGRCNYIPRPQCERSAKLRELLHVAPDDPIAATEMLVTDSAEELTSYFDTMLQRGLEGVVAKRRDAPYQAGARGYDWVKLKRAYQSKLRDTVDLVLVGYLRGRGKRAALGIGSVLAAVYDPAHDRFRTVAKIGSGLSDADWRALRAKLDSQATSTVPRRVDSLITPDVWTEPMYVVEVLADEITRSPFHTCGKSDDEPGYALRFPRIIDGIRTDKAPTDATTEREILDLFRMQRSAASAKRRQRSPASKKSAASKKSVASKKSAASQKSTAGEKSTASMKSTTARRKHARR